MSADQRRDGDNAQLPVRGLSDESRLRDALDRKIADAVHRIVEDGRAEPRQSRERAA